MIKIIYSYHIFFQQQYGGVSRYFYEIAKRINNESSNFSANIVAPFYKNQYFSSYIL